MFAHWMKLWLDWTMLTVEAQAVIGLRLMMLGAGGTAAQTEVDRMLTEKASAHRSNGNTGERWKRPKGDRRLSQARPRELASAPKILSLILCGPPAEPSPELPVTAARTE